MKRLICGVLGHDFADAHHTRDLGRGQFHMHRCRRCGHRVWRWRGPSLVHLGTGNPIGADVKQEDV